MNPHLAPALVCALVCVLGADPRAQDLRYHIGLRVRSFERGFEQVLNEVEARERVRSSLEKAVSSFFAMRLNEVARHMDIARHRLSGGDGPGDAVRWADALLLDPESRLLDTSAAELKFELRSLYRVDVEQPKGTSLRLMLVDAAGKVIGGPQDVLFDEVPHEGSLRLSSVPEGDHRLHIEVRGRETVLSRRVQTISCAPNLSSRLEKVLPLANAEASNTRTATMRGVARLVRALSRGRTLETDIPAVQLLAELERLQAGGKPGAERAEDVRIWLHDGKRAVPARVLVPDAVRTLEDGSKVPLVIAMHGAGGTENLFFDGYGAGKIVALCRARGWLLVAPRSGMFGRGSDVQSIVDALGALYPVDRECVFGVGHSMGSGQLMGAASARPARFRAVAALGGGGRVRASEGLRRLPVFVAAGAEDFGLRGARRLKKDLQHAGVERVRYEVYESTEHMGIVQVALDGVFAFFDEVLQSEK